MSLRAVWTIAGATLHEALRRRILLAAVIFGAVFVLLFGFGFAAVRREIMQDGGTPLSLRPVMLNFFVMAGLYAVNFLTVLTAACLPVDTMSGEIASGVMQTVAAKPISRATIVLGKWLGHAIVLLGYLTLIAGGLLLVARVLGGVSPPNLHIGLPLLALEGLIMLTMSIALGTRLSTIANAVTCIGLYGLAFLGGWFEQVGTMLRTPGAGDVGVVASLVFPAESMWQLAAYHMQPVLARELHLTPFSVANVPSPLMVAWAIGYVLVCGALAVRWFSRRAL